MNVNKRKSTPQLLIEKLHLGELAPSKRPRCGRASSATVSCSG